ncbi:alpha/beta hydrolase [Aldersonia sp. NBC_00410]|uniref:alpha/beta fold hydrolase n=1 Tax=Aldersonia sp. NBC_00410 TaxID=2975954 RepID=UPI00224F7D7F|nr:alpha/beta fold hydrolase [Aldersonia sp. NBC_00410]MCX5043183.1 alpha/beta hydrolase [Aldersonia sp. NBC_00410]
MLLDTPFGPVECGVSGARTTVLVLHGSPGGIDSAQIMARFLPRDRFRVITVSRPGYLGTPLGANRTIDDEADRHAALLDTLDVSSAGVLSWSGGGPVGFQFAARHPGRVHGLVAIAPVATRMDVPQPGLAERVLFATPLGEWAVSALGAVGARQIVAGAVGSEGTLDADLVKARVEAIMADDDKRRFVLDITRTAGRGGKRKAGWDNDCAQFAAIEELDFAGITAPTMIVAGTHDSEIPFAECERAASAIPGAALVALDHGTHLDFYTYPDSAAVQAKAIEVLVGSAAR